jgi:Zn-dependent peptidase ImmA (M78 family)/predicted secreted protein
MTTFRERRDARLKGSAAATRQWVGLGLDAERPVDIFGVIEDQQVWLLFEPLDHLYGFFQRQEDAAGIVLHNGHPLSLQRFTAAHEYGHFALGHESSQDSSRELFGGGDVPLQELEAQAFAAEFLMPLPLVNRALDRLSLPREPNALTPMEAYQLSLEMGSSYRATITQLNQLNKIRDSQLAALRKWETIQLKVELGRGRAPANRRADVWDVDDHRRGRRMQLRLEDELHVRLPEIPSSGYRWQVDLNDAGACLELLVDELEPDLLEQKRLGGGRRRHLWWKAVAPGAGTLDLRLVRPWQGLSAEPVDGLQVPLSVQTPRTGLELPNGISLPQRRAMLQEAA